MCINNNRINAVEKLLLDCTELRDLFHPTDDYPTYESMVDASIDWAIDNHDAEEWSFEKSAINEMLYYKMHSLVGVPNETLHPIYEKLIESIK